MIPDAIGWAINSPAELLKANQQCRCYTWLWGAQYLAVQGERARGPHRGDKHRGGMSSLPINRVGTALPQQQRTIWQKHRKAEVPQIMLCWGRNGCEESDGLVGDKGVL